MGGVVRFSGFGLAAAAFAGLLSFTAYCQLHALAAGVLLPWSAPLWWGVIAGVPAGGLAFAVWRWRDRVQQASPLQAFVAAVFGAALAWGVMARGVIGPGQVPDGWELAQQLFAALPVAAALAGAAALLLSRQPSSPEAPSPWIHLPEEPLLRLGASEVSWVSAAGNYCEFHASGRVHLVRISLARTAERLKAQGFARAHRSTLVNLAALLSIEPDDTAGRAVARLRCGTTVPVGKRFR